LDGSYLEALYVSPQMETLTGHPSASFLADPELWLTLIHPDDRARVAAVNVQRHLTGELIENEYRIVRADGRTIWVREAASCVEAPGTDTILSHGFLVDITDRKELEQQLSRLAFNDPLTGLANRALFEEQLAEALARRPESGLHPAVLYLDIDNFKGVNDSLGHAMGDRLLKQVGERIRAAATSSDCVARIGGDEFAVLLPAASARTAIATADRVIEALHVPVEIDGRQLIGRASIGVAVGLGGAASEDLLRDADAAMYRAKATSRGSWVLFEAAMHRAVLRRFTLEADLRVAVASGQVGVAYQVVTSLATGRATGAEALARWQHPTLGEMSPATFIEVAEESDLIIELGLSVLRTACQQAADWRRAGLVDEDFTMGVNVSARQMSAELPDVVTAALEEVGLPARNLVIEITETAVMADTAGAIAVLTELRRRGVAVAIDDFGTGYSSLGYLRRLPIDIIKIDQSFVRDVGEPVEGAIVGAVIQIAAALSMAVVAEGIETPAQATILRDLGCQYGQGFLFGHPVPAGTVRIAR
jgi:diguanylate cyclase (GGDEF)-like protein/PAS domain S-box-containing protein